eukprot:GHVR01088533.1.p1 GENE.GHVR01088533.1~~GHVR01088533.1.p1  ORF type:complete len:105 (-),score=44.55 GHVR01088533.1:16-300(-)
MSWYSYPYSYGAPLCEAAIHPFNDLIITADRSGVMIGWYGCLSASRGTMTNNKQPHSISPSDTHTHTHTHTHTDTHKVNKTPIQKKKRLTTQFF